jgi:hypothetical protein
MMRLGDERVPASSRVCEASSTHLLTLKSTGQSGMISRISLLLPRRSAWAAVCGR